MSTSIQGRSFQSSQCRALFVAEILSSIIQFNSRRDAARCARVCREWHEISLDYVWTQLPGLKPMFEILAPLVPKTKNGPLEFSRPITSNDWNRLEPFLRRVKQLNLDVHDRKGETKRFLDDSVFLSVLASFPYTTMLPNLQYLGIRNQGADFDRAPLFVFTLSRSVKKLDLHVLRHPSNVDSLAYFLQEAKDRAPNIQQIMITDCCRRPIFNEKFEELIPKFVKLEHVVLSSCSLNTTVLSALSTLPSLKDVRLRDFGTNNRLNDIKFIDGVVYRSDVDPPFPSLRSLTLQTQLLSAIKFLSNRIDLSALIRLSIDVVSVVSIKAVSEFIDLVAQNCPGMTQLDLFRIEDREYLGAEDVPISSSALKSLKHMKFLETFTLSSTRQYAISDLELAQVLLSCSKLKCFRLLRDPATLGDIPSKLTLNLLSILADSDASFSLDELNLDVNASDPPRARPSDAPKLRIGNLLFAYSFVRRTDIFKTASYLDSVFDRNAHKSFSTELGSVPEIRWSRVEKTLTEEEVNMINDRLETWKLVSGALELISETREKTEETMRLHRSGGNLGRLDVKRERLSASGTQWIPGR